MIDLTIEDRTEHHHNRTTHKLCECISKVTVTPKADARILQVFLKYPICAKLEQKEVL